MHGRRAKLIELNPVYAEIATKRINALNMGPEEKKRSLAKKPNDFGPLFGGEASV
jgi:DNA modification methylase